MHALIEGQFVDLSQHEFFGGMTDGQNVEDLYRTPGGTWLLHTRRFGMAEEPTLNTLSEDEAVGWLLELRQSRGRTPVPRHERGSVPEWVVPRDEYFLCGRSIVSGPPPIGQQVELILPKGSVTAAGIEERQTRFLEPGKVLEHILWPPLAPVAVTAGFRQQRHDPLVARLLEMLEASMLERPRLSILQSLQDRGCDLLIEWPLRAKYGVQLKSNGDAEEDGFANKTLAQIQDSRQHGLERLFVILAVDITEQPTSKRRRGRENSNEQKVQGFVSRISAMKDPYVVVVPPERAWNLLFRE